MTIRTPLLTVLTAGLALFALSCTDRSVDPTGPQDHAGETVGPVFAIPGGFTGSSCLELVDIGGPGDGSPCDARLPAGYETGNGVYWLSPLTASPGTLSGFVSGYADLFVVDVDAVDCSGSCASDLGLVVTEGTGLYETAWKTRKNGPGAKAPESVWRVKLYVKLPSSEGEKKAPIAYRDVRLSDTPSLDQPADEDILVIQRGSNQPIKFWVTDDINACVRVGDSEVTCVIGGGGGTLELTAGAQVNIGPNNGTNTFTATYSGCDQLDGVDFPLLGCSVSVTSPTLAEGTLLEDSSIEICAPENSGLTPYVVQQDGDGVSVLPRVVPDIDCDGLASAPAGVLGTLQEGAGRLASLFGAKPLIATSSSTVGVSGGGGIKRLSDFQLGFPPAAAKDAGWVDGQTVLPGASVTASVVVCSDEETGADPTGLSGRADCGDAGTAIDGATIWFFPDDGGTLTCPAGFTCDTTAWWSGAPAGALGVRTSAAGIASVEWEPSGAGTRELKALGCGIAVPGSNTPPTSGALGVVGVLDPDGTGGYPACDRDPSDEDDGTQGYANGVLYAGEAAGSETLDAFLPYDTGTETLEIAINDLPITFSVETCASPTIDGDWEDSWECVTGSQDFDVNLSGGGKGAQPQATLLWKNDGDNLYLAVLLPRDGMESSTSLWFEFDEGDLGDGIPSTGDHTASANDDLFGVHVKNGVQVFSDRYLDAGCAGSSGSSVCNPVAEASEEIDGAVAYNDLGGGDTFMFYELSHPLCSEQPTDFCLEPGDEVGLFVRLAVGNGAQGNTMWPDFRDYYDITIQ